MNRIYLIAIILLVQALVFAIQNPAPVALRLLFWKFEGSMAFVTLVIFVVGFLAGWLLEAGKVWKKNNQLKDVRKKMDEMQKSLDSSTVNRPK